MLLSTHLGPTELWVRKTLATPGIYAVHSSGATVGAYQNSLGRVSAQVGYTTPRRGGWALSTGVLSGYSPGRVQPYAAISYRWGGSVGIRLITVPFHETFPASVAVEYSHE